jgi:peptidoglycan-N-acetylglucosamine deacetylase
MKKAAFFSALVLILIGCSKPKPSGGIVFSFDGQSVQNWIQYRDLFKKYNIRATFFINPGDNPDDALKSGLKALQSEGNEIACHGISKLDPSISMKSASEFYAEEAEPELKKMKELGFNVVSYAYTYVLGPDSVDKYFLNKVKYLRKATWNKYTTSLDNYDYIYARPDSFNVVHSMGIDCINRITLDYLQAGIARAKKNDEVLVLHAHKIDATGLDYTINPAYLEQIFKLCNKENIESYRMQDMEDFFRQRAERQSKK